MYASVLRLSGHEVQVAHDGTAGLKAAREGDFDLVLLDIRMPGRDGMSVLAELAQDTHSREWPVSGCPGAPGRSPAPASDRKSTRLNSSHANISYAVFCFKKRTRSQSDR